MRLSYLKPMTLPLLIVCILVVVQFVRFIVIPADPGFDGAWQLQAAMRLNNGDGLTASMDDLTLIRIGNGEYDLSSDKYNYLTNWPPMYSLLLSMMLMVFSVPLSIGLIDLIFWVIGIVGWYRFIKANSDNGLMQSVFIAIVGCAALLTKQTSMFVWALFPYIIIATRSITMDLHMKRSMITIMVLCALLVSLRYQMLSFVLAIPLLVLLSKRRSGKMLLLSIICVSPAVIVYLLIVLLNKQHGIDLFTSVGIFDIGRLHPDKLISIIRSIPFFLPNVVTGYSVAYMNNQEFKVIFATIVNSVYGIALYYYLKGKSIKDVNIIVVVTFGVISFLQLASQGDYRGYNVFILPRYWVYLNPLFIYIMIEGIFIKSAKFLNAVIGRYRAFLAIIVVVMLLVTSSVFVQKSYANSKRYYDNYARYTQFLDEVVEEMSVTLRDDSDGEAHPNVMVYVGMEDNANLSSILLHYNKYPVYRRLDILNHEEVYVSGNERILLMVPEETEWQSKISHKWKTELLQKRYNYCIYLLSEA